MGPIPFFQQIQLLSLLSRCDLGMFDVFNETIEVRVLGINVSALERAG